MAHRPPMAMVPDPAAMAAQSRVIDAQKELSAIQFAQQQRDNKAKNAINYILLPYQNDKGITRQQHGDSPEEARALAAAHNWIAGYFSKDTDFEAGIPVREATAIESPIAAG